MSKQLGVCPTHGETDFFSRKLKGQVLARCVKCTAEYNRGRGEECRRRLLAWLGEECLMCGTTEGVRLHFIHLPSPDLRRWGIKRTVRAVKKGGVLLCYSCCSRVTNGSLTVPPEAVRDFHDGLRPFRFREHARAKLSREAARSIREDTTSSNMALAREHGVDEKLIRLVRKGEKWAEDGPRY